MPVDSAVKRKSATHNMKPGLSGGFPGMTVKERRQASVWSYVGISAGTGLIGCLTMIITSIAPRMSIGSSAPSVSIDSSAPRISISERCGDDT